ncbi:MAG TPA: PRTRC system protein B [Nevskia sp.]|nr:PRTRC system protein B [Nevskia sp.]
MLQDYLNVRPEQRNLGSGATVEEALVLSRIPGAASAVLLTHHKVLGSGQGARRLGDGTPVAKSHAIDLLCRLSNEGEAEFLPGNVVCHSPAGIAWHVPARRTRMHWRIGKARIFTVPWPALYFVAGFGHDLRVFALASDERPKPDTKLFHAPIGNVYSDGSLCWGSIEVPPRSLGSIGAYEDAIYKTAFSHTNTPVNFRGAARDKPEGLVHLWETMHRDKPARFPNTLLLPHKLTAGSALKGEKS